MLPTSRRTLMQSIYSFQLAIFMLPLLSALLTSHRIINPLAGIPKHTLLSNVADFCAKHGLSDKLPVFEKGALVAQSPNDFDDIAELDEDDRYHLRREITRSFARSVFTYVD